MKGSVYKRCNKCGRNVKKRSCPKCRTTATSWAFRIYVGKGADGKWIERRKAGFETKRDAERALTEVAASVAQGTYVQPSAVTVADYLRDEWLPATAPPRVRHETWQDRRNNLERHIISRLGRIRLQDLTAAHLNRLYGDLLTDGRADGDGGLSPTSVHRVHGILRKALNDAVRWGLLERNVATLADPPTMRTIRAARRRTMRIWNDTELRTFLENTSGHRRHAIWLVTAFCGLRRSEVLGLRWHDIDLDARVLTVRATVVPGAEGYELTEEQKSDDSGRTIHLDKITVATLRRQHAGVAAAADVAGPAWQDRALVFPRADGTWENPPAISLAFHRAVSAVDVPAIRFHDLRVRHLVAQVRRQPQGRLRTARPQLSGIHARHVRARHAGHAAGGRGGLQRPGLSRGRHGRRRRLMGWLGPRTSVVRSCPSARFGRTRHTTVRTDDIRRVRRARQSKHLEELGGAAARTTAAG